MTDAVPMFELIEEDTSHGGTRRRRAVYTEAGARKFMDALAKVGAMWVRQDWGWRTVPRGCGPVREIRRMNPPHEEA